jgi:hypothetical protein
LITHTKERMHQTVNKLQIEMSDGNQSTVSMIELPEPMSLGEALTLALDMRPDKSMYLVGHSF